MATRRYGISRGERRRKERVTEAVGAATAADGVELTVDLAVGLTKYDVLNAIDQIKEHVARGNWPPA